MQHARDAGACKRTTIAYFLSVSFITWGIKSRHLRAPEQRRSCSLRAWKRRLHLQRQSSQQRRPILLLQRLHPHLLLLKLLPRPCLLRRHCQRRQSLLRSPSLLPQLKPQLPLPVSLQSQRQSQPQLRFQWRNMRLMDTVHTLGMRLQCLLQAMAMTQQQRTGPTTVIPPRQVTLYLGILTCCICSGLPSRLQASACVSQEV